MTPIGILIIIVVAVVLFVGTFAYVDHRLTRSIDSVGLAILDQEDEPGGLTTRL